MSAAKKGGVVLPLVLIFLFTVVVALVGMELYTRHTVGNELAQQVSAEVNRDCKENADPDDPLSCQHIGIPVKTRFGAIPILFSVPKENLPQIEVRVGPFPREHRLAGTMLIFDAHKIDYSNRDNLRFGDATAEVHIPPLAVQNQLNAELRKEAGPLAEHVKVNNVEFLPDTNQLRIELSDGLIKLTVTPSVRNGKFAMELTKTEIAGSEQPFVTDLLRQIVPNLAGEYMDVLPPSFTAESLEVKDNSMVVTVRGANFTAEELAEGTRQY